MRRLAFYCKPTLEPEAVHNSRHWVRLALMLAQGVDTDAWEIHWILNEWQHRYLVSKAGKPQFRRSESARLVDLPLLTASLEVTDSVLNRDPAVPQPELVELFRDAVGDLEPDVVISISDAGVLPRAVFPDAVHLSFLESPFTRPPFRRRWVLDPHGIDDTSLPNDAAAFADALAAVGEDELALARRFREQHTNRLVDLAQTALPAVRGRSHTLLLPLQGQGVTALDNHSLAPQQQRLLLEALAHVPDDVGVVVTEHPQYPVVSHELRDYLSVEHPRCVFVPDLFALEGSSQLLLGQVDSVAAQTSSVGMQASLLFGRPVVALSRGGRLAPFADATGFEALASLTKLEPRSEALRDRMLAFVLTRYSWSENHLTGGGLTAVLDEAVASRGRFPLTATRPPQPDEFEPVPLAAMAPRALDAFSRQPFFSASLAGMTQALRADLELKHAADLEELRSTAADAVADAQERAAKAARAAKTAASGDRRRPPASGPRRVVRALLPKPVRKRLRRALRRLRG